MAIPTRDRWGFAARALRSALAQRGVTLEVVLVDDGSRSRATDVPELDDLRVRVIRQPYPRGVAAARNLAVANSRGEWVAFLDDDDLWAPDKLECQLRVAAEQGAEFVWTGQLLVDRHLTPLEVRSAPPADGIARALLEVNRIGGPSSVIARREALDAVGGFDERLSLLADWDLWIRLATKYTGAACEDLATAYTIHRGNMHIVAMDSATDERDYAARKHSAFARAEGLPLGGKEFLEWVAVGYRRQGNRRGAARTYLELWRTSRSVRDMARACAVLFGERAMRVGGGSPPALPLAADGWVSEGRAGDRLEVPGVDWLSHVGAAE